jgi:hypothetical protein
MFLRNLFDVETLFGEDELDEWGTSTHPNEPTIKLVGWPMEYMPKVLEQYKHTAKKDKIIFPHRLAPEKQLEIFKDLAAAMPQYEWFVAQEQTLTKDEYHQHLAESKLVFSANLQETLGISMYEGALVGTLPLMPDRLSYTEMWQGSGVKYPSEWTKDWDSYQKNKNDLMDKIKGLMETNQPTDLNAKLHAKWTGEKFFTGAALYKAILDPTT